MNAPTPIETYYHGLRLRSRTEARWAVFFDTLGIEYQYEKEGYDLGDGVRYLPDFWLPDVSLRGSPDLGVWVEIKGKPPTESEFDKAQRLATITGHGLVLFVGTPEPWSLSNDDLGGFMFAPGGWQDNLMTFMRCYSPGCGAVKIEFGCKSYMTCPVCGGRADDGHPDIRAAYNAARGARFEFGESGSRRV